MWRVFTGRLTQVLSAALCVLPSLANAQPDERQYVALDYQVEPGSSGCPSEKEFRARLSSRLGYDPHRPEAAPKVLVLTRNTSSGLEGVIRWTIRSGNAGPRVFDSPKRDCAPLIATMAFVLAVQIQLMAGEGEQSGTDARSVSDGVTPSDGTPSEQATPTQDTAPPAPKAKPAEPPTTPQSPPPQSSDSARDSDRLLLSGGGGASVALGLAPDLVFQGRLFVGARLGSAAFELAAEARPTQTATFARGAGFRHEMWVGSLAACSQQGPLALCATAKLGQLEVSGVGVDRPLSAAGVLVQLGPRVAYEVPLSRHLGLLGRVDANYLLSPWVVRLDGAALWSVPRLSTVAGIDLAIHFH
jgi:hypothetical protein